MVLWVMTKSLRRGTRSAITPPNSINSSDGTPLAKPT